MRRIPVTDDHGAAHVVDEYQDFLLVSTLDGTTEETAGMRRFRMGNDHCNLEDDGSFIHVRSGARLRPSGR